MKILLILIGLFSTFIGYCCCVATGKADRVEEAMWEREFTKEGEDGT